VSEQEIREGMLLAVWDEPPLDFDPDTLIRRVEQKKSRRRALVAVGVATAMIAVASFALPGLLPRDRESQLGSPTDTTASSTPPSLSVYGRQKKIGDALASRLQETRQDLKEIYPSFDGFRGTTFKPETPLQPIRPDSDDMYGFLYFTDSIGPTALLVTMGDAVSTNHICGAGKPAFCRDVPQQDGTVVTEAEFQEGPERVKAVAMRRLPDGKRSVIISAYSHNPSTMTGYRQMIPVSVDVLTALVMDRAITWE
jgi:hypothetical protein